MGTFTDGLRSRFARIAAFLPSRIKAAGYTAPGTGVAQWLWGAGTAGPHEPFAGAWQSNITAAMSAGPNILAYSAVYACVNIISSDIARMPVRVMRPKEGGGREEAVKHPATFLFRKPNDYQTLLQFLQHYFTSKLINGNTYVLILRDARGVPWRMYVLDPNKVRPMIAPDGSIFYQLSMDELSGITGPVTVPSRNILHDRAATFWHPLVGVSPLFAAGVSAMTGSRILMNSEKFFANMSRAGGVLTAPGKMTPENMRKAQVEWDANYSGQGIGKTAVLANGLEFKPMTINAIDAMLVDQLRWTVEDIARVYRVPGFKLGDLNKVSYRNSEQMARDYFQGCLSYHIESFEQCMKRSLELAEDISVEYDLRPLFRMETDTRYDTYAKALAAGFLSINEVRAEEDLPPVAGGYEPRVQAQYIPLSKANGVGVNVPGVTPAPESTPEPADEPDESEQPSKSVDMDALSLRFIQSLTGVKHGV